MSALRRVPVVLVSVHDVAPASATATRTWTSLLEPLGVPLSFLVIAGPWRGARFGDPGDDGSDLAGWLRGREQLGDEICLHGWYHRADRPGPAWRRASGAVLARGAGEFWALDRETAADRGLRGLELLHEHGLTVVGVTPPGWLAGGQARRGLADAGLRYLTDHRGVVELATGRRWPAVALCHRPVGGLTERAGAAVVGAAWRLVRSGRSVRIAVHPADLRRPGLIESTVAAVRRCLDAGAVPATYRQVLPRLGGPR